MYREATAAGDLPDDCLARIFSRLHSKADRDAAALTCRRWRAFDALYRHALYFMYNPSLPDFLWTEMLHHQLPKVLCTFPHIHTITIEGCGKYEYNELHDAFFTVFRHPSFARLTTLHIEDCWGANDGFVACLALGCPALKDLSLRNTSITHVGLHFLAHGCSHLISLNLSKCRGVTDSGIDAVLRSCPNMKEMYVSQTTQVQGWGFRNGKALTRIVAAECNILGHCLELGLKEATFLRILWLPFLYGEPRLAPIGKHCKNLQALCLTSSESLDDDSIREIAQGCQDLRIFHVAWCHRVTLVGWQALAISATKLGDLDVRGCQGFYEDSLLAIQGGCPSLRCLKVLKSFHRRVRHFQISRPDVAVEFYDNDSQMGKEMNIQQQVWFLPLGS